MQTERTLYHNLLDTLAEDDWDGWKVMADTAGRRVAAEWPPIALVGHTVINRAILLGVMGLGDDRFRRIRQEPCAIHVFEVEADDFTLVSLNDSGHLQNR